MYKQLLHKAYIKQKLKEQKLIIEGFCNSNYAEYQNTRKSVSGYVIYVMGCLLAWKSKSKKSVTLPSSEAEYVAIIDITIDFFKSIRYWNLQEQ